MNANLFKLLLDEEFFACRFFVVKILSFRKFKNLHEIVKRFSKNLHNYYKNQKCCDKKQNLSRKKNIFAKKKEII